MSVAGDGAQKGAQAGIVHALRRRRRKVKDQAGGGGQRRQFIGLIQIAHITRQSLSGELGCRNGLTRQGINAPALLSAQGGYPPAYIAATNDQNSFQGFAPG